MLLSQLISLFYTSLGIQLCHGVSAIKVKSLNSRSSPDFPNSGLREGPGVNETSEQTDWLTDKQR